LLSVDFWSTTSPQHRENVRSELGLFRAGPSDRLRSKVLPSRLRQVELFALGEFIDHGRRVAKMLYDHTGVQKKAISRRRHQSDRLPLARLSRKPRLPRLAYFRVAFSAAIRSLRRFGFNPLMKWATSTSLDAGRVSKFFDDGFDDRHFRCAPIEQFDCGPVLDPAFFYECSPV
jgi:hypothetical protein